MYYVVISGQIVQHAGNKKNTQDPLCVLLATFRKQYIRENKLFVFSCIEMQRVMHSFLVYPINSVVTYFSINTLV